MPSPPSLPDPSSERWPLAIAFGALLAGLALVTLALTGAIGHRTGAADAAAPPKAPSVVVVTPTPAAAITGATAATGTADQQAAPTPSKTERKADERRFLANDRAHVPAGWVSGFYDIY